MSQNYSDLIQRVRGIRERYTSARNKVMSEHPTYDRRKDIRVNFFSKCINSLDALFLGFLFYNYELTEPGWWEQVHQRLRLNFPPPDDLRQWIDNFAIFLKIGYIQTLVSSAIESSIRTIAGYIDQKVCEKKGDSFKAIYRWLLTELNLSQYESLLDMLRCTRNVNHDNGVFYGRNEDIMYRGMLYHFENEKTVNFVTWDLLLDISSDVLNMICSIVKSNEILIKTMIEDRSVLPD